MSDASVVPVTLLAGFLGAGKTTVLNRVLSTPEGARSAVIVNEFGAVGVDGKLVLRRDDEVIELANGCVCCELRGDLREALLGLARRRDRALAAPLVGRLVGRASGPPPFDRVLIEASGLAAPGPAVQTFLVDGELAARYRLGAVVTVAHAAHIARQIVGHPEAAAQLAYADRVLLNHADATDAAGLAAATAAIQGVQPFAEVRVATRGAAPTEWVLAPAPALRARDLAAGGAAAGPTAHSHGIRATVLTSERPLRRDALEMWLRFLAQRRTLELMRVKGVLATEGPGGRPQSLIVQGVHQWLELVPSDAPAPDRSELVVIARGLDEAELRRGFEAAGAGPRTLPGTP
ncbi:MAG: GTP-binding protein [Planctomycetota bacterium]